MNVKNCINTQHIQETNHFNLTKIKVKEEHSVDEIQNNGDTNSLSELSYGAGYVDCTDIVECELKEDFV